MSVLPKTGCCPLCRCSIVGGGLGVPGVPDQLPDVHSSSSPGSRRRDSASIPLPRDSPRHVRRTNSAREIHEVHEILPVHTVRQSPRHLQDAGHYPGVRATARQTTVPSREVSQEIDLLPQPHVGTSTPNSSPNSRHSIVPEASVPLPP